jgi:serine/threonine-protein kinase
MSETAFGKYRLVAELGHGGMADVFLAVQAGPVGSGFRKLSVIKRLRQNLAEEPEFIAMLVDEARIAARLNHPNVVQTNEVGEVDNLYFIAMEYLDGQPLHRMQYRAAQRTKAGEPSLLTKEQQYLIVAESLAGLHHAHELADYDGTPLNIVHRDVTPHNIFITYEGQVKVVDFGIAKAAGRASETRQGVVKGKVRYMPPEQALGRSVDRRADIFSAGIMLWEAATGRRMWQGMDDIEIVHTLVSGEPPTSPRQIDPTVPEEIDRICMRALHRTVEERYATAEDFRVDIEQYLAESGKLVEARRKLGAVAIELFKDKRAEIRSVIETQLAALEVVQQSGDYRAVTIPTDSHSSPTPISHALEEQNRTKVMGDEKATEVFVPKQPPPSRIGIAIGVLGTIAALGAAVAWVATHRAAAPVTATKADVAVAAEVALRVEGSPPTAQLAVDDQPAMPLPIAAKLPRDGQAHRLRITAEGFTPKDEVVRFDHDISLTVDLAPAAAAARSAQPGTAAKLPPPAAVAQLPVAPVAPVAPTAKVAPPVTAPVTAPAEPARTGTSGGRKAADPLDKGDPWGTK